MLSIAGYTVTEQLYESAHTLVCRARRNHDGQPVILKILKADYPTPAELARYHKEYELLGRLRNADVIQAQGQEKYHNGLLLVLEDIGAVSLTSLRQTRMLPLAEVLALARKIVRALEGVHAAHLIHRDLNPSNIIYNPDTGQLKLIDFGLAVMAEETPAAKPPEALQGMLPYISPEQTGRLPRAIDYRTDYYALGVTLYELLTGHLPFEETDPLELVHAHLAKAPPPPHLVAPEIPPVLSAVVLKLLEKNPEDRYQSAAGLLADLAQCAERLQATGGIEDFTIGRADAAGTFRIPDKLYGREAQLSRLLTLFEGSAAGRKELVLCPGAPGIGKSALIEALRNPVTEQRGLFLTGKYDRFEQNIPYTGMAQAFQGLVRSLLTESAARLNDWKTAILQAVGANGRVVLDVIPDLALILGPQPAVQPLPPLEAQNRFNLVFQNFVKVFARPDHPLVLFLDDLQWADPASLQLFQVLFGDPELRAVVFLGAYRDAEVDAGHPLPRLLHGLTQAGLTWAEICLAPLTPEQLTRLLCETLRGDIRDADALAALIHAKTAGNAFFAVEFSKRLHHGRLLTFADGWQWDVAQITQARMTDNVAELMTSKITQLPPATWQVLQMAAGLGFESALDTLARVCGRPAAVVAADLDAALQEGVVTISAATVKFAHDRVHEAAYALIAEPERPALHYRIGQTLLAAYSGQAQDQQIFSIAGQLNRAAALLDQTEARQLAELNLKAGQRAKDAVAYGAAFTYFTQGVARLPADAWTCNYELAYTLYLARAETAYSNGYLDEAAALFALILRQANNPLDQARAYEMQMPMYLAQTKLAEAFEAGRQALALLGFGLPAEVTQEAIMAEIARLQSVIGYRAISDLAQLPPMTDPAAFIAIRCLLYFILITFLAFPAWYPIISIRMVKLSVESGKVSINLLNNAVKFTAAGGVTVRIENCQHQERQEHQEDQNRDLGDLRGLGVKNLRFSIADTGPGIAPEEMEKLFEAFTQTATGRQAQEGTGLGLAISRKFVRLLGGDMTVQSKVGQGTTFTFEIQCQAVAAVTETAPVKRAVGLEPGQPCYRLLIADDQPDNRKLLVNLLQPFAPATAPLRDEPLSSP